MTPENNLLHDDPRVEAALVELENLIRVHYPGAIFQRWLGEDPEGVYLRAIVDVEDTDEVVDIFIGRLMELQMVEGVPVYAYAVRPTERVAAMVGRRPKREPGEALLAAQEG